MSRFALYAVFGLAFLLAAAISLSTVSPIGRAAIFPSYRYCFHTLYSALPDDARVLLIGSSRIWLGVEPDQLARELGLTEGSVINLAHTHRDYDFDRHIVETLTRDRAVDLVLFDTLPSPEGRRPIGSELRAGERIFGAYYVNGSSYLDLFSELAESPRGLAVRLHDMLRAAQFRHQRMVPLFLSGRVWQTLQSPQRNLDRERTNICWDRGWDRNHRVFDPEAHKQQTDLPEALEHYADDVPDFQKFRAAHEDIAALEVENGFRAAFLFAPAWRSGPAGADFVTEIETSLGLPYLAPPETMIVDLKASSYGDIAHFNRDGRAAFTSWLARTIQDESLLPQ